MSLFLHLVEVSLNGNPTLQHINCFSQISVIYESAKCTVHHVVQFIDEDIKQYQTQD